MDIPEIEKQVLVLELVGPTCEKIQFASSSKNVVKIKRNSSSTCKKYRKRK